MNEIKVITDLISIENKLIEDKKYDLLFKTGELKDRIIADAGISHYQQLEAYEAAGDLSSLRFKRVLDQCFELDYQDLDIQQRKKLFTLQGIYEMRDVYDILVKKSIPVVSLKLVRETSLNTDVERLENPKDVHKMLKDVFGNASVENLYAIYLDIMNQPTAISCIAKGTENATVFNPKEMMKIALLSNASRIILAHNHPSGDLTPSYDDIESTYKIMAASELLGIQVLDHLIISADDYISMNKEEIIDFNLIEEVSKIGV